jgi:cytochrome c-type biogenesis protein CcmE
MTLARPAPTPGPRRRRGGLLLGIAGIAAVFGYFAWSGIGSALVYYLTPSELLERGDAAVGQSVRLGGLVKDGSMRGPATDLHFVLTDGENEVPVHTTVAPPAMLNEGIGAVVEGSLNADGLFQATQVIVKHDEHYEAPPPGELPDRPPDQ